MLVKSENSLWKNFLFSYPRIPQLDYWIDIGYLRAILSPSARRDTFSCWNLSILNFFFYFLKMITSTRDINLAVLDILIFSFLFQI